MIDHLIVLMDAVFAQVPHFLSMHSRDRNMKYVDEHCAQVEIVQHTSMLFEYIMGCSKRTDWNSVYNSNRLFSHVDDSSEEYRTYIAHADPSLKVLTHLVSTFCNKEGLIKCMDMMKFEW